MSIVRSIVDLSVSVMLVATASNLLYLYYNGAWYDPCQAIEIAEVVVLYALTVGGLINAARHIRCLLITKEE